jgi:hypothetical protein
MQISFQCKAIAVDAGICGIMKRSFADQPVSGGALSKSLAKL